MSRISTIEEQDETLAELFKLMGEGKSLRKAAKQLGHYPNTLLTWIDATEDRQLQYARAFITRADYLVEEMLDIADASENDISIDGEGNEKVNNDAIQRARLRVDTRKWFASKLSPKKYGDRVEQLIKADVNLRTKHELSDDELASIALQHIDK